MDANRLVSILSIGIIAVGAFLPWVSIASIDLAVGIDGDGVFTLGFAVVGGILLTALAQPAAGGATERGALIVCLILAALTTLVAALDMNQFSGTGLYLTLLGGIAWLVTSALELATSGRDT